VCRGGNPSLFGPVNCLSKLRSNEECEARSILHFSVYSMSHCNHSISKPANFLRVIMLLSPKYVSYKFFL
jgi:hypothetical protein